MLSFAKTRCTALLTALLLCCTLLAQPYCVVRTFGHGDALVTNKVNGFVQDMGGLMWFSSWNGLMCYDGYSFTSFKGNADNAKILSSKRMYFMRKSALGGLWCVSYYGDLYYYDNVKCRFIDVSSIVKEKTGLQLRIVSIKSLPNGHTWMASRDEASNLQFVVRIQDKTVFSGMDIEILPKSNRRLEAVLLGDDGREWLHYDKALVLYDRARISEKCSYYSAKVVERGRVSCCFSSGHLMYYATASGRLMCYDTRQGRKWAIVLHPGVSSISSIAHMGKGQLVCATNVGVVVYDLRSRTSRVYPVGRQGSAASGVFVDSRHRIWAFSQERGVTLISTDKGSTEQLDAQAARPEEQTGSSDNLWLEDANHTVWCVPKGGTFSYFDETTQRLVPYILRSVDFNECIPLILRTFVDSQGNLWCTAPHSVHMISFGKQQFAKVLFENHQETRSLLYDHTGRLWAGNVSGRLAIFDGGHTLSGYWGADGSFGAGARQFCSRPYFLFEDNKQRIWVATKGSGLYLIDKGKVQNFRHDSGDPYSLCSDTLFCVEQDTQGRIWVGAYGSMGGLNLVDESSGQLRFINRNNVLRQYHENRFKTIRRIACTKDGILMLSTCDGIVTFCDRFQHPGDIVFHYSETNPHDDRGLPSHDVMQIIVMRSGRIFVATLAGELCEIEAKSLLGRLRMKVCNAHSSVQGIIMAMQEDANGQLWIVRENCLERFDPTSGNIYFYDVTMKGELIEFSEALPSLNRKTGELAIGTINGMVVFRPQDLGNRGLKPRIVFPYMYFHGDTSPHPILYSRQVELPSDRRSVTINFAALDYANAGNIRYAYKLEGVDKDWQYIGKDHKATFSHLPCGHFRLLVKSTDSEGKWLDNTATLYIYAHPTFWESWMAYVLYFVIVVGLATLVWHYLDIRRKAKMEKEMHEQKAKLYTDASHRLRTPLTLIGGPVSELLMDKSLPEKAREMLEMVRRNVRSMLEMTNNMLSNYMDNSFFVDDEHIPVFGKPDEALVGTVEKHSWSENIRMLVVEDNDDMRAFLRSVLSTAYSVITASNGKEGLEKAISEMPDFIITDVTMPVMDGLTMVHEIKQRQDICHIPIIVLSAKASLDDRLKGLEEGIDDYITKPFSAVYLKNRVDNIISQRHVLQQRIVDSLQPQPQPRESYRLSTPEIVDYDKRMMEKLMEYLEEHIGDSDLRINDMAQFVGMNRATLFTKLKSIVGMTPVDFVRHLRMQRAIELVAKSEEPFSQIAYSIGFTDSRYFSRVFKKETGMTPSEYRAKAKDGQDEEHGH